MMTIGSWDPAASHNEISKTALTFALTLNDSENFPEQAPSEVEKLQPFMKVSKDLWEIAVGDMTSDELKTLCKFFTLAEQNWNDWFAGDKNPVIWICKILKTRNEFPDKELTSWIKKHTENRYLPYGNLFG